MLDIRLIALDLDGTLLNSDKKLSEKNRNALERAAAEGIEIVPATGRFYRGMPQVIRDLPFVHYVISINGAQVYDVREDKSIFVSEIDCDTAIKVMEQLDKADLIYDCYQNGWGWMTQAFYDKAQDYAASTHSLEMIRNLRSPVSELKAYLKEKNAGVQKVQAFFKDIEERAEFFTLIQKEFPDLKITTSMVNNIEINSNEANKGNALKNLADYLGFPLSKTMAFGDDLNDISMIETAGIGVAMGNADDFVKKIADFESCDCDNDGIAFALEKLLWEKDI